MFSRLATLRLLPATRGSTTSAMSRCGRSRDQRARDRQRRVAAGRAPRTRSAPRDSPGRQTSANSRTGRARRRTAASAPIRASGRNPPRPRSRQAPRKAPRRESGGGQIAPHQHQHRREADSAHWRFAPTWQFAPWDGRFDVAIRPEPVPRRRGVAPDTVSAERNLPRPLVKLPLPALTITFSIRACHVRRRDHALKRPLRWRLTTRLPMRLKHEAESGKLTVPN